MPGVEFGSPTITGLLQVQSGLPKNAQTQTIKTLVNYTTGGVTMTQNTTLAPFTLADPGAGKIWYITKITAHHNTAVPVTTAKNIIFHMTITQDDSTSCTHDMRIQSLGTSGFLPGDTLDFITPLKMSATGGGYIVGAITNCGATATESVRVVVYGFEENE